MVEWYINIGVESITIILEFCYFYALRICDSKQTTTHMFMVPSQLKATHVPKKEFPPTFLLLIRLPSSVVKCACYVKRRKESSSPGNRPANKNGAFFAFEKNSSCSALQALAGFHVRGSDLPSCSWNHLVRSGASYGYQYHPPLSLSVSSLHFLL